MFNFRSMTAGQAQNELQAVVDAAMAFGRRNARSTIALRRSGVQIPSAPPMISMI